MHTRAFMSVMATIDCFSSRHTESLIHVHGHTGWVASTASYRAHWKHICLRTYTCNSISIYIVSQLIKMVPYLTINRLSIKKVSFKGEINILAMDWDKTVFMFMLWLLPLSNISKPPYTTVIKKLQDFRFFKINNYRVLTQDKI